MALRRSSVGLREQACPMFVLALVGSLIAAVAYILLAKFILVRPRKDDWTQQVASWTQMAKLSDEERRALVVLSRHPEGCEEAVLLTDGFTVRQLAGFVIDGFATGSVARITLDGREKPVVWMTITEAGRQAIADCTEVGAVNWRVLFTNLLLRLRLLLLLSRGRSPWVEDPRLRVARFAAVDDLRRKADPGGEHHCLAASGPI
jgi:hypothetical protein